MGRLIGPTVCVVIPSIPPRRHEFLPLALSSVFAQEYPIDQVSIAVDTHRQGAWATRQRALDAASTDYVAFLDDDDELYPQHVSHLMECMQQTESDYCFSYFDTTRTGDVLGTFGKPFNANEPHSTTMCVLVRTKLAQQIGFREPPSDATVGNEDWLFTLGCINAGAKITHLAEQTWFWRHHVGVPGTGNTSGLSSRWG